MKKNNKGFSIPELIVTMAILSGLYFLGSRTLIAPQRTTNIETTVDTLVSDIANQQNRSMTGDIATGTAQDSYGIYFQSDRYTTFKGTAYSGGNTTNFVVRLNPNLQFSTVNLPNAQIIFATSSGAIQGYVSGQNNVTLNDSVGGLSRTIQFNSFGVIDQIQ